MREITTHRVNPANDRLTITVTDEPGAGGANHRYEVTGFDTETNASRFDVDGDHVAMLRLPILFQNGPIPEKGVNGVTQEALLSIIIDRLKSFQSGPFACRENAVALTHLETGLLWLHKRTLDRMNRGVEGTHSK